MSKKKVTSQTTAKPSTYKGLSNVIEITLVDQGISSVVLVALQNQIDQVKWIRAIDVSY